MKIALVSLALVACGGVAVEPADAGEDQQVEASSEDVIDAAQRGLVCITDQINGSGFKPDGGCDLDAACYSDDGSVGVCK